MCSQEHDFPHLPCLTADGASAFSLFPRLSQGPFPTTQSTFLVTAVLLKLFSINLTSLSTEHIALAEAKKQISTQKTFIVNFVYISVLLTSSRFKQTNNSPC